ncbi:MAG: hypothetical protein ACYDGN_12755 [Acidimicrobiales bacterium]
MASGDEASGGGDGYALYPGQLLDRGQIIVLAAVSSYNPTVVHAMERDAVRSRWLTAVRGTVFGGST